MSLPPPLPPPPPSQPSSQPTGSPDAFAAATSTRRAQWPVGVGIGLVVVGTFLPWARSGRVGRNSYQLAGVGSRLSDAADWWVALLRTWPYLGPLWAVAVVLMILGRTRAAPALALVLAAVSGVVALGCLVLALRPGVAVTVVATGPLVTAVGASVVATASVASLRRSRPPTAPPPAR